MAAERTLTKAKLEADICKAEREAHDAAERAGTLRATLRIYYPESELLRETEDEVLEKENQFDSMNIAEACQNVLQDLNNRWLSLTELDEALQVRGKQCNKGSIEIMLKANLDRFEIKKDGRKNLYRLKVYDVNQKAAK